MEIPYLCNGESLSVSENCKWRIRHNYEEGIPNGFQIYGYDIKKRKITINEDQAAIVREIFNMYSDGIGSITIAKALNKLGIPSPKNSIWHKGEIILILRNEKYIGELMLQKYYSENHISKRTLVNNGELKKYYVTENHEPIIEKDIFEKVQRMLDERNEKNPHIQPYDYPFKNMVFCGECGAKYYRKKVHTGTPSEKFVWKCNSYNNKGKEHCTNKQIPDDVLANLSEAFEKQIHKILIMPENNVKFIFEDGSEEIKKWEINRKWSNEMKQRNYENQRRRCK